MSENECNHWSRTQSDGTVYCKDCFEILSPKPYWWGTISVGKMKESYKREGEYLDLGWLIEEFLGVSVVKLTSVTIVNEMNSWKEVHQVVFTIGTQSMTAAIDAIRSEEYEPTGKKFEVPAEVEAE